MKTRIMTALSLGVTMTFAQTALELTTAETFAVPGEGTLLYRQHLAPGLPPDAKIPLVIFLHGIGERGNDNQAQLKHAVLDLITFADANGGAVVVAPQCPKNELWVNTDFKALAHSMPAEPAAPMKLVLALIDSLTASLPVDPDRVYVTGLSLGGFGTWDIIQRRPKLFAAAIPVCGGGDTALASAIKHIPVWIFHGDADTEIKVSRARDMEAALKTAGGNVKYREYPGVGHDCWTPTYADPDVLKWMFGQRRAK